MGPHISAVEGSGGQERNKRVLGGHWARKEYNFQRVTTVTQSNGPVSHPAFLPMSSEHSESRYE